MSRYTGPKGRLVRRFGVDIFGTEKFSKLLEKRQSAPGMHGAARTGKSSEYKKQLLEKQKLKFMYGLNEKQLRNYYLKASSSKEATGEGILKMLEKRLDNVVYRSGFAKTRFQARQMVNHGNFNLNGRRVTIPSIQIREGDTFEVRPRLKSSALYSALKDDKSFECARWLKSDAINLKGEIVALPESKDLDRLINSQLIVEFYSK